MTTNTQDQQVTVQTPFFDEDDYELFDVGEEVEVFDLEDFLSYEEIPLLVVDTDPDRTLARLNEMMEYCFDGIGEERKEEKRIGLAMQQLDIENRHALRLLLTYQTTDDLIAHLQRCLKDPAYGYGKRGDQGRTIAQAMAAIAEETEAEGGLAEVAEAWLEAHRDFQQSVLAGTPLNFLSMFDDTDLDQFVPWLQRVGDMTWRLGIENEGKFRDFEGSFEAVWPDIGDTYVAWCDEDNEAWLANLKRQAARLPDNIFRVALADQLRKQQNQIKVEGNRVSLITITDDQEWPQSLTMVDETGEGQLGLSRLSGHSFYEVSWEGGLHLRRFEVSGTTRSKVKFEHIEMAMMLAETIGAADGLKPALPPTAEAVEAAYLRRMKAQGAELGSPGITAAELPSAISGTPAAAYIVDDITVIMLLGGDDFAYITMAGQEEQAILLQSNEKRGVMMAVPVRRGRPRRGSALMTTPLADLNLQDPAHNRAVCSWGAWLAKTIPSGK